MDRSRIGPISEPLVARPSSFVARIVRAGRWEAPVGFVVGVAVLMCALLAVAAAVIGLATDGRDVGTLALVAILWSLVGGALTHQCRVPLRMRSTTAFVGAFVMWTVVIAVSTATYEILGTFAHWDDSIFESVAGFTTTAATVVENPETLSRATLFWRAGTQWIGGLGALLFVVAVLPSIGVGGLDVTDAGQRHSGTSLRSRRTILLLRRLTGLYAALTVTGVVLYLIGGMGPFDAITYAATTISTGGFANHAGSFGHFRSATVEWAGFGGMILGGANLALLFRAVRPGTRKTIWRSSELRAYLAVIFGGGAVVALLTESADGLTHEAIRRSLFHVASAASTTGHFVGGWSDWEIGGQVFLLAIIGVGAMSGSAGGGFRLVRALTLVGYLRRELVLQIHPRAVTPVRVGRKIVSDALVSRMIGYQAQYLIVAASGAVVVAALGGELVTAMSGAISAVANMGPALGDLVPGNGGVLGLPRPARAALMPLMLLGRLEIAPVLVGAALAASAVARRVTNLRRRVDDARSVE
ncbi:TrkH family potassium uptake protein [Actinospongicola halichondriae]|uniref:TrkH family potassium uptake protein n=1 Tax=Actinospongicola halichondriae TaxID=3236844 RepID=UPI003D391F2E